MDEGTQLVMYTDKEGKPLLKSLPSTETLDSLDFSIQTTLESSTHLKNGWELKPKTHRIDYRIVKKV